MLAFSTVGCIVMTALLGFAGPDQLLISMLLLATSAFLFGTGENLIAAFLPEIAPPDKVGKVSGFSWALGYVGGLLVLALCLVYIETVKPLGQTAEQYVPVTLWITATIFALAAAPTFLFLKERSLATGTTPASIFSYAQIGFSRLGQTLQNRHQFRDLFRFLVALCIFSSGVYTVIVIAAIYAQEVMNFSSTENIIMIMVVNITAAIGAFVFGLFQDRLGAKRTLELTLLIWILAISVAWQGETKTQFWIAANLIGLAMGSSQSAGRALVALFSPDGRSAEFFGLWGLSIKLAAIIGPMSYGLIAWYSEGDHRQAIFSTLMFFVAGLIVLFTVNEKRGREAAVVGE
jgi:UMF1 family MFS transporter